MTANGLVCDDVVDGVINVEDEVRKEDERPNVAVAEGSTTGHGLVLAKAV